MEAPRKARKDTKRNPGGRRWAGSGFGAGDDKVHEFLRAEEAVEHVVTLTFEDLRSALRLRSSLSVLPRKLGGVFAPRHERVFVAVQEESGDAHLRDHADARDGIQGVVAVGEFLRRHAIGGRGFVQLRVAAQVEDRIDARDPNHAPRRKILTLRRKLPRVSHHPSTAEVEYHRRSPIRRFPLRRLVDHQLQLATSDAFVNHTLRFGSERELAAAHEAGEDQEMAGGGHGGTSVFSGQVSVIRGGN